MKSMLKPLKIGHAPPASQGSVMLLVISFIIILTFQLVVIGLLMARGLPEEGILSSKNISARRATEIAIARLVDNLYIYLQNNDAADAETAFAKNGTDDLEPQTLKITNPANGSLVNTDPAITISAWVQERRGFYYQIAGRAQTGGIDLVSHQWVYLNPCPANAGGEGNVLSTILPAVLGGPGWYSTKVSPIDGRVYFGTNNSGTSDRFFSWDPATNQLSTLLTGIDAPGYSDSVAVSPVDGRVYFGQRANPGNVFTWDPSTKQLSTILPAGVGNPGSFTNVIGAGPDGRVFFSGDKTGGVGNVWTWSPTSKRLSTILPSNVPNGIYDSMMVSPTESRVYFGNGSSAPDSGFWTWYNNVLVTIVSPCCESIGSNSMAVSPVDGRVYFGESANKGGFWTWKSGVLTTIVSPGSGSASFYGQPTAVSPIDGRVYFGGTSGTSPKFQTWHAGRLSVILDTVVGDESIAVSPEDGRVFFGDGQSSGKFWTWKDNGTGAGILSTILTSYKRPGDGAMAFSPVDGRLFFGAFTHPDAGQFFSWHESTGLSSLLPAGLPTTGYHSTHVSTEGRVYFGNHISSPSGFFTWDGATGLSTLHFGLSNAGVDASAVSPIDGRVYWSSGAGINTNIWTWTPGGGTCQRNY